MNEIDPDTTKPPAILVVEDDEQHQYLMMQYLALQNEWSVDVVKDAQTAIERLRTESFDAVVLDYTLPDANGLDVLKAMHDQGRDLPVVMVTSARSPEIAVAAMKAGATDFITKDSTMFEHLPETIAEAIRAHNRQQMQQRRLAELEHLACVDFLTNLANRRVFDERFRQEWERARRYDHSLALAIVDLDDFKRVNDTYGHRVGDQALVMVSRVIRASFRVTDVTARYGGDEFVILMPETDKASAYAAIGRFQTLLGEQSASGDLPVPITASVGLAFHADEPDPETLLESADRALLAAKLSHRQNPSRT